MEKSLPSAMLIAAGATSLALVAFGVWTAIDTPKLPTAVKALGAVTVFFLVLTAAQANEA